MLHVDTAESVFSLRLRVQTQTDTWGCDRSESRATAWYLFEVRHHINMLLVEGKHEYAELSLIQQMSL